MSEELIGETQGHVGFVTIFGRPNVGKSTFINHVLGYHLTAVSSRPNTTRKKWMGILSDDESQIIFADTPGVHSTGNKMQEAMAKTIATSIQKNDMVLCLCDATREFGEEDRQAAEILRDCRKPAVLAVNKSDLAKPFQIADMVKSYRAVAGELAVFEISALTGDRIEELLERIRSMLPVGPFLFAKDQLSDAIQRDIAEEIIREAANELVFQEVPQDLTVKIEDWKETDKKVKIDATIYVEREAQKGIVIGAGGSMINAIIKSAREKLRQDLDKFVEVKLKAKVARDWQNQNSFLRSMGVVDVSES